MASDTTSRFITDIRYIYRKRILMALKLPSSFMRIAFIGLTFGLLGCGDVGGNDGDAQLVLQENSNNVFVPDDIHDAHDEDHE